MGIDLNKKTYLIITGASRGIGQRMAVGVAEKLANDSVIVLLARAQTGLNETKSQIEALGKKIQVLTYAIDLSKAKAEQFREIIENSLKVTNNEAGIHFERAFIIHNAGSVGDVSKFSKEVSDTDQWTTYFHLNVFSVISLNVEFFKKFESVEKLVVNISSKCAIEPFPSMGFYCTGKAGREMYFRMLAKEENENVIVLNYAPGMVNTDMSLEVQQNSADLELAKFFKEVREKKNLLTPTQTTEKFLKVLEENKFTSGDHVDYHD